MLAGVADPLVHNLTQVDPVCEQMEDATASEGNPAAMGTAGAALDLGPPPFHAEQRHDIAHRAQFKVPPEDMADHFGLGRINDEPAVAHVVSKRDVPPIQIPFFFDAAILSRISSPVTSRSNWAKDNRTFSVSRPMLVVVLNA
jgi:hypothetical protein